MDTWILVKSIETNGERNRTIYILKSRGMAHSNQIREFTLTCHGVELRPVYIGPGGVLTGSARITQEAQEYLERADRRTEIETHQRDLGRKRKALEAHIAALRADFDAEQVEALKLIETEQNRSDQIHEQRAAVARSRKTALAPSRAADTNKGQTP